MIRRAPTKPKGGLQPVRALVTAIDALPGSIGQRRAAATPVNPDVLADRLPPPLRMFDPETPRALVRAKALNPRSAKGAVTALAALFDALICDNAALAIIGPPTTVEARAFVEAMREKWGKA